MAAAACYEEIASSKPKITFHPPSRVTRQGNTVIEYEDEGTIGGKLYRNRIADSYDVRGDQICGYREYFGDIDPAERDRVDLHQAFAEIAFGDLPGLPTPDAFARVGRQELHYGAGRLVSVREKPNVHRDFDGGVARLRLGPVVADAFLVQPTTDSAGTLDNRPDRDATYFELTTSYQL